MVEETLLEETFATPRLVPEALPKVNCPAFAWSDPPIVTFPDDEAEVKVKSWSVEEPDAVKVPMTVAYPEADRLVEDTFPNVFCPALLWKDPPIVTFPEDEAEVKVKSLSVEEFTTVR